MSINEQATNGSLELTPDGRITFTATNFEFDFVGEFEPPLPVPGPIRQAAFASFRRGIPMFPFQFFGYIGDQGTRLFFSISSLGEVGTVTAKPVFGIASMEIDGSVTPTRKLK